MSEPATDSLGQPQLDDPRTIQGVDPATSTSTRASISRPTGSQAIQQTEAASSPEQSDGGIVEFITSVLNPSSRSAVETSNNLPTITGFPTATGVSSFETLASAAQNTTATTLPNIDNGRQTESGAKLPVGAIAGIAVGGVLIIAAIITIVICVRRKKSRLSRIVSSKAVSQNQHSDPAYAVSVRTNTGGTEKSFAVVAARTVSPSKHGPTDEVSLPQQADDATIRSRFSTLFDQIELHVENFYRDASPVIPPATEDALFRYDTPIVGSASSTLEESPRATTVLKHILAYEIVATIIAPALGDSKESLLPKDLSRVLQVVQSEQRSSTNQGDLRTPAYANLKSTAARYRSSSSTLPQRDIAISANQFSDVFSLWADAKFDSHYRGQHLTEVMNSALIFSVWLFSQPEQFELDWKQKAPSSSERSLIITPSLLKVSQNGHWIEEHGLIITQAVFRTI